MSNLVQQLKDNEQDFEFIHKYTRADALSDGQLVDVTEPAKEAGFKWPVAITCALDNMIKDIPKAYHYESYDGRLWDVLFMAFTAIKFRSGGREMCYKLILHHGGNLKTPSTPIELKLVTGPGDNAEPVVTIMLPDED